MHTYIYGPRHFRTPPISVEHCFSDCPIILRSLQSNTLIMLLWHNFFPVPGFSSQRKLLTLCCLNMLESNAILKATLTFVTSRDQWLHCHCHKNTMVSNKNSGICLQKELSTVKGGLFCVAACRGKHTF